MEYFSYFCFCLSEAPSSQGKYSKTKQNKTNMNTIAVLGKDAWQQDQVKEAEVLSVIKA